MNVQVDDIKGVSLYELQGDIEELLAFAEARSFKSAVALASLKAAREKLNTMQKAIEDCQIQACKEPE